LFLFFDGAKVYLPRSLISDSLSAGGFSEWLTGFMSGKTSLSS